MISGVSSASAPAATFSSTYTNYRVLIEITNASGVNLFLRLRTSGSDNATSNYNVQFNELANNNKTTTTSTNQIPLSFYGATKHTVSFDIFNPNTVELTRLTGLEYIDNSMGAFAAQFNLTTVFDSFSVYPASSTTSGTIFCYGYNK